MHLNIYVAKLWFVVQEFGFISGLVRIGNFSSNELVDVLHMLFPGKTEEAIKELLDKIHEEDKENDKDR